jgi:hypothetical protein
MNTGEGRSQADLRDRLVHFRVGDVYMPDPQAVLCELYGDDLLQGRVLDYSDSGARREAFAVVSVEGVKQPVIVPVDRILGVL